MGRLSELFQGDSGNGLFYTDPQSKKQYLLGVNSFIAREANATTGFQQIAGHEDLTQRYEELCYYLGLCLPGYEIGKIKEGLSGWKATGKLVLDSSVHSTVA